MKTKTKSKRRSSLSSTSTSKMKNGRLFWQQKNQSNISLKQLDETTQNGHIPIDKNQLRNWGLSEPIIQYYARKGISRFFDWQIDCLQLPGVLEQQKNLVYSAPTSAGKTMVSDILLFKTLLDRRKKAIIILPFVSISMEKVQNLKQVFRRLGLRIDSFAGQTNPRGGLKRVDAAVCTIEKANNMINRLIEERTISDIGLIIVDELHMIGDQSRGYILELLLSKLMHMKSNPLACNADDNIDLHQLQIVGMSATIPNLNDIAKWLNAELFITDYRPVPLDEHVVVGNEILKISSNQNQNLADTQFNSCASTAIASLGGNNRQEIECHPLKTIDLNQLKLSTTTMSHSLIYLAIETLAQGFSTLIFCPTRSMCESMAKTIAANIFNIGQKERIPQNDFESFIRERIHSDQILSYKRLVSLIETLKRSTSSSSSGGFDPNLERVLRFGCAFHHAGMTMEERGTVEQGFRDGTLRILCCTTTLSAGVNLPARRVMITSPFDYANNLLPVGNYRQMIGRAGRKGIDILGESFLFCSDKDIRLARRLLSAEILPIKSNLVTVKKSNNNNKTNTSCSTSSTNSDQNITKKSQWQPIINDQLLRAVLEVIANEMVKNISDISGYLGCTFFRNCPLNLFGSQQQQQQSQTEENEEIINESIRLVLDRLKQFEFIYIESPDNGDSRIVCTDLGRAVISSGVSPTDGQFIYEELKRFRAKLSLLTDLHLVYQTTPVYIVNQLPDIDWRHYLNLYERWDKNTKFIAQMIGISEHFLCIQVSMSGLMKQTSSNESLIHRRFYASLALFDLIEEIPMWKVQQKYNLDKGTLQSLQQQASTFAGMLSTFCQRLNWKTLAKLFDEFQPRLSFGVQLDLIDLVRLPCVNSMIARQLFNKCYEDISSLINLKPKDIELALITSKDLIPDDSSNVDPNEVKIFLSTLDQTITITELSKMIIKEARMLTEKEIGQKISFEDEIESGSTVNSPVNLVVDQQPEQPEEQEEEPALSTEPSKMERSNESIDNSIESTNNNKRIKTDIDLSSINHHHDDNDYMIKEVPIIQEDSNSDSKSSIISSSTPNVTKQIQSTSLTKPTETSILFDDDDDDFLLEELSLILTKKESEKISETIPQPSTSKSLSMSTMSIDADLEILEMLEQEEDQKQQEEDSKQPKQEEKESHSSETVRNERITASNDKNDDEIWLDDKDDISFDDDDSTEETSSVNSPASSVDSKEDMDKFLQSLSNNDDDHNEIIHNLPSLHESNVTVDNFELIKIDNRELCRDFLAQIFPETDQNIVALYFRLERRKDSSEHHRRTMIVLKPGHRKLSTQQPPSIESPDEPVGLRLKHSPDLYLISLYVTKLNQTQIFHIDSQEALKFLQQNWFKHLQQKSSTKRSIHFVCHDVKQACRCLNEVFNFEWKFLLNHLEWYDVTIAQWLLDPESSPPYNIDSIRIKDLPVLARTNQLSDIDYFDKVSNYYRRTILLNSNPHRYRSKDSSIQDLDIILKILILFNLIDGLLLRLREENLLKSYFRIEIPSRICITMMESNPTKIDRKYLNELEDTIQDLISRIEQKIVAKIGRSINLNSPDQVGKVLYSQEMGLISSYFNVTTNTTAASPSPRSKSKRLSSLLPKITPVTRKPSTSKIALMRLQESVGNRSNLPTMIIEWRHLNHALTNSIMAINRHWYYRRDDDPDDSLIYKQCCEWTATGRITMLDPNLINLDNDFEIKTHLNDATISTATGDDNIRSTKIHIRKIVQSPNNYQLITADYCQLELRILAHFSKDKNLLNVLNNLAVDVFKSIAADWKQIPIEQVDYETRQQAKQICYGIVYGMGDESLAQKLDITSNEAGEYKQSFFDRYNRLQEFINKTIDNCRQNLFVETIAGRRRQLPLIRSPKLDESSRASRQAVNTKIQGSAADIIKMAMISVQKQIVERKFDACFVLQMYDELMYQVRIDQCEEFGLFLKQQMEMVGDCLRVVLPVKLSTGRNWSEMDPFL